jgi:hypothetical protein
MPSWSMGALLEKSPIALAFNRILCGPLPYKMKAHPIKGFIRGSRED